MNEEDDDGSHSWFDFAEVCANGHVICAEIKHRPEMHQDFCGLCGAKTQITCLDCKTHIRGLYHQEGVKHFYLKEIDRPKFCGGCGRPYPWTMASLKAADELIDTLDKLSNKERDNLKIDIADLARETPRAPVAITRTRLVAAKVGREATGALKEILLGVISDVLLKQAGLG